MTTNPPTLTYTLEEILSRLDQKIEKQFAEVNQKMDKQFAEVNQSLFPCRREVYQRGRFVVYLLENSCNPHNNNTLRITKCPGCLLLIFKCNFTYA